MTDRTFIDEIIDRPKEEPKNNIETIYLDMDGVIVDFAAGVAKVLGKPMPDPWPAGVYSLEQVFEKPEYLIWRAIDSAGSRFWSELEPYETSLELYRRLSEIAPVVFCSTPSWHPSSPKGKLEWLGEHFGAPCRNYVFTPNKYLLARPGAVLVDDLESNVLAFKAAGGSAVLVPQPWNCYGETGKIMFMCEFVELVKGCCVPTGKEGWKPLEWIGETKAEGRLGG